MDTGIFRLLDITLCIFSVGRYHLYLSVAVSICCQPAIRSSSKVRSRADEPFSPVAEYLIGCKL